MLSIGIRCGQGFDKESLRKLIETGKRPYEFDFLILGSNPGGMICAKEAAKYGKKVALVYWRIPTPGEHEGYDEDRQLMAEALLMNKNFIIERTYELLEQEAKTELMPAVKILRLPSARSTPHDLQTDSRLSKWRRRVRASRLELTNAVTNMSVEGIKYIHEIAVTYEILRAKNKTGKILPWKRMMEQVVDYIIQRNWTIITDFLSDRISLYDGLPILMDEHTVELLRNNGGERIITAETIISAGIMILDIRNDGAVQKESKEPRTKNPFLTMNISAVEVQNTFPKEVAGAKEYGINLDDFFRLSTPPGKTLIVGAGPRGMECAGILASFSFPVVVIDRSSILKNGDPAIVAMIVKDMTDRGVTFMEKKSLVSIKKNKTGENLVADFFPGNSSAQSLRKKYSEEFDTVLFTTKEKFDLKKSGKTALQFEIEKLTGETYSSEEKLLFENVVTIPDQPNNCGTTQLIGKHVAEQLLDMDDCPPKLRLIPNIVLTPYEYAYVGISESSAKRRFGEECIQVFTGYIPTEDVIFETDTLKDDVCYAKVIIMFEKDLIVGLHLFGRDAVRIMNKIMEPIKRKMLVSNLHESLKTLLRYQELAEEVDEIALRAIS